MYFGSYTKFLYPEINSSHHSEKNINCRIHTIWNTWDITSDLAWRVLEGNYLNFKPLCSWRFELDTLKWYTSVFIHLIYLRQLMQYNLYKISKANFFTSNTSTYTGKEERHICLFEWTMKELMRKSNVTLDSKLFCRINFGAVEMTQLFHKNCCSWTGLKFDF